jgi:hypothetical protein
MSGLSKEDRMNMARAIVRRAVREAIQAVVDEPDFPDRPRLATDMMTAKVLDSLERPALRNAVRILGGDESPALDATG